MPPRRSISQSWFLFRFSPVSHPSLPFWLFRAGAKPIGQLLGQSQRESKEDREEETTSSSASEKVMNTDDENPF
jgi:hypothetical protein